MAPPDRPKRHRCKTAHTAGQTRRRGAAAKRAKAKSAKAKKKHKVAKHGKKKRVVSRHRVVKKTGCGR